MFSYKNAKMYQKFSLNILTQELPPRFDRITLLSAMPDRNPTGHRESTMLIRFDLLFSEVMSEMYA